MGYRLTKKERELLEEIPRHLTVLEAARALQMSESYAYTTLYRLRKRILLAEEFVANMRSLRRREPTLTKLLTPRKGGDE
jgi:molybdenum-dependent DNA-binding transcriptional regulator ModE